MASVTTVDEENDCIKIRFLTQAAVSRGLPPLRLISNRFREFCERAASGTVEDAEAAHMQLMRDLLSLKVQARKLRAVGDVNERDQAAFDQRCADLEAAIQQAHEDIKARKASLEIAKIDRQHLEEYEALRDKCMQHATRSSTQAEIDAVNADLQRIAADIAAADALIEKRRKQFSLLIHCIGELQTSMDDEALLDSASKAGDDAMQIN